MPRIQLLKIKEKGSKEINQKTYKIKLKKLQKYESHYKMDTNLQN